MSIIDALKTIKPLKWFVASVAVAGFTVGAALTFAVGYYLVNANYEDLDSYSYSDEDEGEWVIESFGPEGTPTAENAAELTEEIAFFIEQYNLAGAYLYDMETVTFEGYIDLDVDGYATEDEMIMSISIGDGYRVIPSDTNFISNREDIRYEAPAPTTEFKVKALVYNVMGE